LIEEDHPRFSLREQCALLGVNRSSLYYEPSELDQITIALMHLIDREYTAHPIYGVRKITEALHRQGVLVNHKRVARLMQVLGIQSLAPQPNLSKKRVENKVFPYLLRDLEITRPDQVWSMDITYIPMRTGFMYLAAVIDWFSRFVLSWELSNTLDAAFCIQAVRRAFELTIPEIFNTDQGAQFTSTELIGCLSKTTVKISMDGRGRALDNVFTRTPVAQFEIRRDLSACLRRRL
jgi:putative transposase